MMVLARGKNRVVFWIVMASVSIVVSYVIFLAFNPRIGNSLVTVLVIALVYAMGILSVFWRVQRPLI